MMPGIGGAMASVIGRPAVSYRTNGVSGSAQSSYTLSNASLGSGTDRCIIVPLFAGGSARTLNTLTLGGATMNRAFENSYTAFGYLDIADDHPDTADIVVGWSGTKQCQGLGVWTVTGRNKAIAPKISYGAKDGNNLLASIAAVSAGIVIGYGIAAGSTGRTVSWSGLDERFDRYMRTSDYPEMHTGADRQLDASDAAYATIAALSGSMADGHSILMHVR